MFLPFANCCQLTEASGAVPGCGLGYQSGYSAVKQLHCLGSESLSKVLGTWYDNMVLSEGTTSGVGAKVRYLPKFSHIFICRRKKETSKS